MENASAPLDENALDAVLSIMCGSAHSRCHGWPYLMIFRRNPLQLTLLYLSIASLWILFSDALLLWLGLDRDALAHYQSLKGFLFVLCFSQGWINVPGLEVTSVLLWLFGFFAIAGHCFSPWLT